MKVSQYPDIIAIVKVKSHGDFFTLTGAASTDINQPLSATFEIIEILKGKEDNRVIKAFGDDGAMCRPYIDNFRVDNYYVVGLFKCKDADRRNGIKETTDDYFVNECGEYWLDFDNDKKTVSGLIEKNRKKRKTVSLDNFKVMLKPD
jgi:hypothetical protein